MRYFTRFQGNHFYKEKCYWMLLRIFRYSVRLIIRFLVHVMGRILIRSHLRKDPTNGIS